MKQSLFVFRGYKAVLAICVYFDRTGPYCFTTVVSSLGWYPFWVRNTCQKYKIQSNKVRKTSMFFTIPREVIYQSCIAKPY